MELPLKGDSSKLGSCNRKGSPILPLPTSSQMPAMAFTSSSKAARCVVYTGLPDPALEKVWW